MTVSINEERASAVISTLDRAFAKREGVLAELDDLVENQIPDDVQHGSREHALFLFYTVANDHGVKSARLYERAKQLFRDRADAFEPSVVVRNYTGGDDPALIEVTGKRLGTRYPGETAKGWYANSSRLLETYGGDPRVLFGGHADANELLASIRSFRGYGPKTGGMLLRALVGLGFARVANLEDVLVPVDIHDSRIAFWTEIASSDRPVQDYYAHVARIQRFLRDTCKRLNIGWLDVDRALWIIGSRGCVKRRCTICPLNELCSVGRATMDSRRGVEVPQDLPLE
jgi:hypothetical protein